MICRCYYRRGQHIRSPNYMFICASQSQGVRNAWVYLLKLSCISCNPSLWDIGEERWRFVLFLPFYGIKLAKYSFFLFQMPLWHRKEEKYQRRSLLLSLKIHSTTTENADDISGSFNSETIPLWPFLGSRVTLIEYRVFYTTLQFFVWEDDDWLLCV